MNLPSWINPSLVCAVALLLTALPSASTADSPTPQWGAEISTNIEKSMGLPDRGLYADKGVPGKPPENNPAFMWGCGVQLTALAAAARSDRTTYLPELTRFAKALRVYWQGDHGGGYDVLPVPKPLDRYYDDNAWIVLGLAETYEVTKDPLYLTWADETFDFVMTGEDNQLGGGIFWKEQEKKSKHTCINAPATVCALRLYQLTHKPDYLKIARRLYAWTNAHLQDTDGLFWDNIRLDGSVEKMKWTYNSALMIRANVEYYNVTHQKTFLAEAERIAQAAEKQWVRPEGGIGDGGGFAHLLNEAFVFLYDADNDAHWLTVAERAAQYVHEKVRDPNGFYGNAWDRPQTTARDSVGILDQAAVARAFWFLAKYPWTVPAPAPAQPAGEAAKP